MEGFGISVQEAAATKVPVVGSDLIPFVNEYLLGDDVEKMPLTEDEQLLVGEDAIFVSANHLARLVRALEILLEDEALRVEMGERAYDKTVPYFTWDEMTARFTDAIGMETY